MSGWTEEWPTEPGRWWFFGRLAYWEADVKPKMLCVNIVSSRDNILCVEGEILFSEDLGPGLWQKSIVPDLPEEG